MKYSDRLLIVSDIVPDSTSISKLWLKQDLRKWVSVEIQRLPLMGSARKIIAYMMTRHTSTNELILLFLPGQ